MVLVVYLGHGIFHPVSDSTIAPPPKPAIFFNERVTDARHKEGYYRKKKYPHVFLCAKGLSIDDVGVSRDTAFQEMRPGAGSEIGDFGEETLGEGYYRRTALR